MADRPKVRIGLGLFRRSESFNSDLHLYSVPSRDPADYGNPANASDAYPGSFWLPDTGIQRGTVTWLDGDALTYGYPATGQPRSAAGPGGEGVLSYPTLYISGDRR